MKSPTQTLTVNDEASPAASLAEPHLVYVLTTDRLSEPSRRIRLDSSRGFHLFARGEATLVEARPEECRVTIPDPRMSSRHARLEPIGRGWRIEDLGSKNGTLVNGQPIDHPSRLSDGDLLELGHSFFIYRELEPTWVEEDDDPQSLTPEGPFSLSGSLVMRYRDLGRVGPSDLPILLRGESGVGKEVVARALHTLSGRQGSFVGVNCGALPETLVESELFGARKGAFSGAHVDRKGLVEEADGGTLFLDEIGELSSPAQTKLLRVLQERCVVPVGGTRPVAVDFRLVTATHRDLNEEVEQERFRGDLFARIAGYSLELPPLRERREDLGLIGRELISGAGADLGEVSMSRSLGRALLRHRWPYNVRELKKVLLVAMTLAEGKELGLHHVELETAAAPDSGAARSNESDQALEAKLRQLLEKHAGNITQVAREMGKARMQIHRWLKRFEIDTETYRPR